MKLYIINNMIFVHCGKQPGVISLSPWYKFWSYLLLVTHITHFVFCYLFGFVCVHHFLKLLIFKNRFKLVDLIC